jgi:hypothetical protein
MRKYIIALSLLPVLIIIAIGRPVNPHKIDLKETVIITDTTEYTGKYGEGLRRIYVENDKLMYNREGAPMPIEMLLIEGDVKEFYKFSVPAGARTPPGGLPRIRFERDESEKIKGFTFVFDNEREEYVAKDK